MDLYAAAGASVVHGARLVDIMRETMGLEPRFSVGLGADAVTHRVCIRGVVHWRVFIRWGIEPPKARYLAAYQLAQWWLVDFWGIVASSQKISRLAAMILTPSPLFHAVAAEHNLDADRIAEAFVVPKALVLLRLGEVEGIPVAVATNRNVIQVRGDSSRWNGRSERVALEGGVGLIARR